MFVTSIYGGFSSNKNWFKDLTESAISKALSKGSTISTSGSQGGYLSIFEINFDEDPKLIDLIGCGTFPAEKYGRYMYNSIEKAFRLNSNITFGSSRSHTTSRQSADESKQEYPGAVVFQDSHLTIFSFSGLEPEWDEFLSVLVSCFYYYLTRIQKYPTHIKLEDLFELYRHRQKSITANEEQKNVMHGVAVEMIQDQIKLRDKNVR